MRTSGGLLRRRRSIRLLGTVLILTALPVAVHSSSAGAAVKQPLTRAQPAISARSGLRLRPVRALDAGTLRRVSATRAPVTIDGRAAVRSSVIHRVGGLLPHVTASNGPAFSTNWSGQILTGGSYQGIGGNWTVPAVAPSAAPEYAATWIGIDGTQSQTLIQTGTAQATQDGVTGYWAWVELLPDASVQINGTVEPGDAMQSTIIETSTNEWTVTLDDSTQGWQYVQTFSYTTPELSAEWIEEAPTINGGQSTLADFSSATFSDMESIGTGTLVPVYMLNPAETAVIAWPGDYDSASSSFTDYYGSAPPVITSVDPGQGPTSGGTDVVISGDFLYDTFAVAFGELPASFTVNNDGTVTAVSPASGPGTVHIAIDSNGGPTVPSSDDHFTYTGSAPPPTPPPGPAGGYDLVGSDGGVFVFGGGFYGSLPGIGVHVNNVTGIVATTSKTGYFLVGSDGGVFAFNAPFANSLPGIGVHVNNIVGIVPTLDDQGYFLVGRDGGVFSFNAPFANSLPGIGIHVDDIVGIAATADDHGYWVVGSDGTVYAFGDAHAYGDAPSGAVGITATKDGGGYWVVGRNGAVTAFGDAGHFGDLPDIGVSVDNIVGIVVSSDGQGYNLFGNDGGVFTFGDASNLGSLPGLGVHVDNVVGAVPT
jgi:hypothetical protein